MTGRALLISIGNDLRRDDGAGHRVMDLLGDLPDTAALRVHQLTPELAEDLAPYDTVVFIDADVQPGHPRLEPVASLPEPHLLGHSLSPSALTALAVRLYGFAGQALICRVPGEDFSDGRGLSPASDANCREAARILRYLRSS